MARRESVVQGLSIRLIRRAGWYAEKIHIDEMQSRGLPDVVACMAGLYYGIEFKQSGKDPTDMQRFHINEIRKAGGRAGVIDTVEKMGAVLKAISFELTLGRRSSDVPFLREDARDDYW